MLGVCSVCRDFLLAHRDYSLVVACELLTAVVSVLEAGWALGALGAVGSTVAAPRL